MVLLRSRKAVPMERAILGEGGRRAVGESGSRTWKMISSTCSSFKVISYWIILLPIKTNKLINKFKISIKYQ